MAEKNNIIQYSFWKVEDNPRKQMTVESEFYSKQLTQKEHEVYLFLKENIENLKGGYSHF